ncbi:MAG: hypothetical protein LQ337_007028 [Flavoplaca oasis]|nr:MAG: hypothetical protein LQ337_007028 [Flavoplaca oasis]
MADSTPKSYHTDPNLYLYTSLTAGSSQIITATSRLETILKANRIQFQALDVATDEKARMLWGRRAGKRKLPGLDLNEIEEWNEYGELREKVNPPPTSSTPSASATNTPSKAPAITSTSTTNTNTNTNTPSKLLSSISSSPKQQSNPMAAAMRQAGAEAAKKAGDAKALKAKGTTGENSTNATVPESASATVTEATKPASEGAARTRDGADDEEDDDAVGETDMAKGGQDPDEEAVVAKSKDTIPNHEKKTTGDPDAEAVVPGSKDTIDIDKTSSSTKQLQAENKDEDSDTKSEDSPITSQPPTSKAKPPAAPSSTDAQRRQPPPTNNANDDIEDSSDSDSPPPQSSNAKPPASTNEAENLPGKKIQAQEPAKAEEAGTSVGD